MNRLRTRRGFNKSSCRPRLVNVAVNERGSPTVMTAGLGESATSRPDSGLKISIWGIELVCAPSGAANVSSAVAIAVKNLRVEIFTAVFTRLQAARIGEAAQSRS